MGEPRGVHVKLDTDWIRFLENQKEHESSTYHMGIWMGHGLSASGLVGVGDGVGIGAFQTRGGYYVCQMNNPTFPLLILRGIYE